MTETKAKRLIVAGTFGAVLLMVILLSVMVYQLARLSVLTKREENYKNEIARYEKLINDGEQTKEVYSLRWWIEREARKLGCVYEGESD